MRVSSVLAIALVVQCAWALNNLSPDYDVQRTIPGLNHQGITFLPNGDMVTQWSADTAIAPEFCYWTGAANLPRGQTLSKAANARCGTPTLNGSPFRTTNIISTRQSRVYTVSGFEIDLQTWVATQRFSSCGQTHGLAIDPRDGAFFVSSAQNGKVWRIPNPDTFTTFQTIDCDAALYFDAGAAGLGTFDGITIGPDGTFYGAGNAQNKLIIISPWQPTATRGTLIVAKPTVNTVPDGISICVSNGQSFALIANTGSTISRFALTASPNIPLYTETRIASAVGGYLDFTTVDPKGCIWGTTIFGGAQGTYRVTNADGTCGCSSAQVPCDTTSDQCLPLAEIIRRHAAQPPVAPVPPLTN